MKVTVEMTEDELREFLSYREDKKVFERKADEADRRFRDLANKVTYAIDRTALDEESVEIIDGDHAAELLEMAEEILL